MKSSQLEPGMRVAWHRRGRLAEPVKVLDPSVAKAGRRTHARIRLGSGEDRIVPLATLVGTWADVGAAIEIKAEQDRIRTEKQRADRDRVRELVRRANDQGITCNLSVHFGEYGVWCGPNTFKALLDEAER